METGKKCFRKSLERQKAELSVYMAIELRRTEPWFWLVIFSPWERGRDMDIPDPDFACWNSIHIIYDGRQTPCGDSGRPRHCR